MQADSSPSNPPPSPLPDPAPDPVLPRPFARLVARLSLLAVAGVFGACSLVLALLGLGVPFLLAAPGVSALAGLALFAALRDRVARPLDALARGGSDGTLPDLPPSLAAIGRELRDARAQRSRLQETDAAAASLRHNLRGALSPALMMSDRLIAHEDPAVRRAGEIVARSIDRATTLISATRREPAPVPLLVLPPAADAS